MNPGLRSVATSLRVRYSETDRMGIVYHAHYVVWFEIGRTEYCREAGFPYRRMEESGLLILVTGLECRFRAPARYDDDIRIVSRLSELASRGLAFEYEIRSDEDRLLAEGETRHVFADASGRPRRAPEEIVSALDRFRSSA